MFEKDEDYRKARKESKDGITKVIRAWSAREAILHDAGFQDGAEFGYNKANEWKYPSKGELPADDKDMLVSKTLLLITKMKGSDCLSLALGQYNFSTQEFSYQHVVGLTDVYAWKEIVPPSEPMRSFDKEEQKNYTEAISKVYKPTGAKLFDKE